MTGRCKHSLMLMMAVGLGCDPNAIPPEGSPDDVARFTEGLIRFRLDRSAGDEIDDATNELESAEFFARRLYADCQQEAAHPELLGSTDILPRPVLESCPMFEREATTPLLADTCRQALCDALADQCVAEKLYAISSEVENYVSTRYPTADRKQTHQITVPPQSPAANAALVEVAADWASRAIRVSGENLRSGFGIRGPGVTIEGACSSRSSEAEYLFRAGNTLADLLDPTDTQSYAETFIMTLQDTVQFQTELAEAIEQNFSAVAEAERSRNSSPAAAARYAWVEGRTSRARAARVLVGGDREDGLFRVPAGYGSLGPLSNAEHRALIDIRASGVDPSKLGNDPGSLIESILTAMRTHNELEEADYGRDDLLESRGLTEGHFTAAARWLKDAIEVFGANETLLLDEVPTSRFAATSTFELVPPDTDLVANVRLSTGGEALGATAENDVAARRMLSGVYASRSIAASVDYAADLVSELGPRLSRIRDADLRARFEEVLAAGAQATATLRGGRMELCSVRPSTVTSPEYTLSYSGLEEEVTAVAGLDMLRCALTGTIHGAPCTVREFGRRLPDAMVTSAGAPTRRSWRAGTGVLAKTIYLLRVERGESDEIVAYHALAGGRFLVASLVSRCALVPVVPFADEGAARLLRPDAETFDRAATTCAGISSDQRIPLEDELTDDGDAFESSWRHYLTLAATAAATADRLGEAVIDNGLEIERRVEQASAALEGVCGGDVDIDFLASMMAPISASLCSGVPEGGTVVNGDQGYVCRGGVAMPDALSTIEARAGNGDPNAQKLLECMGQDSIEAWVSLGSRPLCLWEGETSGAACIGAREKGLSCPVIFDDSFANCGAQLAEAIALADDVAGETLVAVTVDQNLGIFADTIHVPATGSPGAGGPGAGTGEDDPATLPCDDLRTLRAASSSPAQRATARDRLLDNPWFTQRNVTSEAERLSWEALPYDYGVVTREEEPWAWTGNPIIDDYVDDSWPCGSPIDPSLVSAGGVGQGACADDFGTSLAGPLGCSYVNDCAANADPAALLDRVRMNQRVGRAVTSLRLITAFGMGGMALPMRVSRIDRSETEANFLRDTTSTLNFTLPSTYTNTLGMPFGEIIPGLSAPSVLAREYAGARNSEIEVDGAAYCASLVPCALTGDDRSLGCDGLTNCGTTSGSACSITNMAYLWTRLDQDTYSGASSTCNAACLSDNTCTECWRLMSPCVVNRLWTFVPHTAPFLAMRFSGDDARPPANANAFVTTTVWPGVGPSTPPTSDGVIRRVLNHFVVTRRDGAEEISEFDMEENGGRYWEIESDMRLMDHLSYDDVMDGLELACASKKAEFTPPSDAGAGGVSNDPCSPERLARLSAGGSQDIGQIEDFLRCSADLIETNAERLVMRQVPRTIVESIKSEFGGATLPVLEGERGVLVAEVAADIISSRTYRIQLARVMRQFGVATHTLRSDLEALRIQRGQLRIDLTSQVANQITQCISAASPSISTGTGGASASLNPGAAIATCGNTAVQIGLAIKRMELSLRSAALAESDAFVNFTSAFQSELETLQQIETELSVLGQRLQRNSAALGNLRRDALRSLGQAMLFSSDASGRQLRVNTLLRRRFTTSQARYERARDHAIRMSYLAKLALEQRLGVRLSELRDELTLVEAPSTWEASVCTLSGLDFTRIREESATELDSYADQYIGDYVDRLERTAESYRLDFPFHEGSDTAVVSMRDVLLDTRDTCEIGIEVPNLLGDSADLTAAAWEEEGCVPFYIGSGDDGEDLSQPMNCVTLSHTSNTGGPLGTPAAPYLGFAEPWRLRFGPLEAGGESSARASTRLSQQVPSLNAGTYLLSWYGRHVDSTLSPASAVEVTVNGTPRMMTVGDTPVAGVRDGSFLAECDEDDNDGWCRYYAFLNLSSRADVVVSIAPMATGVPSDNPGEGSVITAPQTVDITGFQLEDLSRLLSASSIEMSEVRPASFFRTDTDALSRMPLCEDTDGNVFRDGWRYDCERVCSSGVRTDCDDANAERVCYWERSFEINQEELLARGRLADTGFAVGNYNYRTEKLALNFVGTGVRDCEDSPYPSSCYGSGYVNYSVEHLGPYPVLNHQGDTYLAPLFIGNIEHARGLSVERYLTNPLSGADRGLIEPYARAEFRGRPLTGQYIVRVWDDDVVDFDRIEDIQILLDYRYWTRFR